MKLGCMLWTLCFVGYVGGILFLPEEKHMDLAGHLGCTAWFGWFLPSAPRRRGRARGGGEPPGSRLRRRVRHCMPVTNPTNSDIGPGRP